jgi:hypothetical protein
LPLADAKKTMWCKGCRQDVPALPSGDKQTLCCSRCGEPVCADPYKPADGIPSGATDQPPAYDGWELDEQLQHIQRMLHAGNAIDGESEATARREAMRFDPPQAGPPTRHAPASRRPDKQRKTADNRGSISRFLTSFVFALGIAGSACGGTLLGWSLATGRHDLWSVGLPVALVGQIALVAGLVLQIDRLWHDNREAAAKLDDVDEQIHELKTTTMLLSTSQGPASATFYSHLAGGAGPQLLLADLKSQLDLLAMKIAQEM